VDRSLDRSLDQLPCQRQFPRRSHSVLERSNRGPSVEHQNLPLVLPTDDNAVFEHHPVGVSILTDGIVLVRVYTHIHREVVGEPRAL